MNEEIERILRQARARRAPPELRSRVLEAVAVELASTEPVPRKRSYRVAVAIAASVLVGFWLNLWVTNRLDQRLAAVLGPPPLRKEAVAIAADIEAITNQDTGLWVRQRLSESQPDPQLARHYAEQLRQFIQQYTADFEVTRDEALQDNTQMDRDHHGSRDSSPARAQRLFRLEYRNSA